MPNKRLKIENLENLQEVNAEEFSSIQGGLTATSSASAISATGEVSSIDYKPVDRPIDVHEPILIYPDPCYIPPPCETYVFYDGEKKIEIKWCPVIL
ncbi:MAG: hypothetical protein QNJ36_02455 [Calothrix sp. MO_167.B42]|nr:hypothetical protein [Calothrix sp. MO_167.B42]